MKRRRYSYAEYLDIACGSRVRYEFADGAVRALPEGDATHEALVRRLAAQLPGASRSLRLRIGGLATYADLALAEAPLAPPDDPDAVTNPVLVAEAVAPETEAYDRGEKFARYRGVPSVRDVLLVTPARVEHYRRHGEGWVLREARGGTLALASGAVLDVGALLQS